MKVSIRELVADLGALAGFPAYIGYFSQVGLLIWSAAAAVCFFFAAVLPRTPDFLKRKQFWFISGMLTLVLGLDDAFLLHEQVFPYFGIPQNLVMICYLGFVLAYLLWFRALILETEYILLVMALFFFGGSAACDFFDIRVMGHLMEDGMKMTGIVAWFVYFFRTGKSALSSTGISPGVGPTQIPFCR